LKNETCNSLDTQGTRIVSRAISAGTSNVCGVGPPACAERMHRAAESALHRFVTIAVTSSIVTEARKKGDGMQACSLRDKAQAQAKCASGLAMLHGLCETLSSCASVSFPLSASTAKLAIVLLS